MQILEAFAQGVTIASSAFVSALARSAAAFPRKFWLLKFLFDKFVSHQSLGGGKETSSQLHAGR